MAEVKGDEVPQSEIDLARKFLDQVSTIEIGGEGFIQFTIEQVTHLLAWYGILRARKAIAVRDPEYFT